MSPRTNTYIKETFPKRNRAGGRIHQSDGVEYHFPGKSHGNRTCRAVIRLVWTGVAMLNTLAMGQTERPDPDRWQSAIEAFEQQPAPTAGGILFVGSSSIRLWDLAASFPGQPVINRGFGGSHLADVSHYVDRIVWPYCPRQIVIYAGDNDIAHGLSAIDVVSDFRSLIAKIRVCAPVAEIYYLSIKPSIARWEHYPKMQQANVQIRRLAETDSRLHFVDVAAPMLDDNGQVRPDLFVADGLHLNAQGYDIWARELTAAWSHAPDCAPGSVAFQSSYWPLLYHH